jgi:hypothetical protein
MPKFTLIKNSEFEGDAEVSVTFSTDQLGLAKDHFDDFLKASGFELPLDNRMSGYIIPDSSEWEWDDDGELKMQTLAKDLDNLLNNSKSDNTIDFQRYRKEND